MTPAVFLDRDGTIIELVHHLNEVAQVRLIDGAAAAIKDLRAAGFKVVVITNQSVIGRGLLTEDGLAEIHDHMCDLLGRHGAQVDGIYFCPLAPTIKDSTLIEDPMRKPGPGMLLQAASDMNLDLKASWMVGDTVSDVLAGQNAGCRTILVKTGYGTKYSHDIAPSCVAKDLADAAGCIHSDGLTQ